jgi:hypothetical protein
MIAARRPFQDPFYCSTIDAGSRWDARHRGETTAIAANRHSCHLRRRVPGPTIAEEGETLQST